MSPRTLFSARPFRISSPRTHTYIYLFMSVTRETGHIHSNTTRTTPQTNNPIIYIDIDIIHLGRCFPLVHFDFLRFRLAHALDSSLGQPRRNLK